MRILIWIVLVAALAGAPTVHADDMLVREVEPSPLVESNTALFAGMNDLLAAIIGTSGVHVGIYFVPFQHEASSGFPFLAQLQEGEQWSATRRKSSKHFLGWTYAARYEGRQIVQMDPQLVSKYYTRDPQGMFTIPNSPLWYAIGHELAHVHLYAKGVPEEDHHCVMVETGIVQKLIDYLTKRNALAFSQFAILRGEITTCENQKHEKRQRDVGTPR